MRDKQHKQFHKLREAEKKAIKLEESKSGRNEYFSLVEKIHEFFLGELRDKRCESKELKNRLADYDPLLDSALVFLELGSEQVNKPWYEDCRKALHKIYSGIKFDIVNGRIIYFLKN